MTGYCPDCGNTMCVCDPEDTRPAAAAPVAAEARPHRVIAAEIFAATAALMYPMDNNQVTDVILCIETHVDRAVAQARAVALEACIDKLDEIGATYQQRVMFPSAMGEVEIPASDAIRALGAAAAPAEDGGR